MGAGGEEILFSGSLGVFWGGIKWVLGVLKVGFRWVLGGF